MLSKNMALYLSVIISNCLLKYLPTARSKLLYSYMGTNECVYEMLEIIY